VRAKYGPVPAALVSGEIGVVELQAEHQLDYPVLRKPLDPVRIRTLLQAFQLAGLQAGDRGTQRGNGQ
jgi:hypothetical protein